MKTAFESRKISEKNSNQNVDFSTMNDYCREFIDDANDIIESECKKGLVFAECHLYGHTPHYGEPLEETKRAWKENEGTILLYYKCLGYIVFVFEEDDNYFLRISW